MVIAVLETDSVIVANCVCVVHGLELSIAAVAVTIIVSTDGVAMIEMLFHCCGFPGRSFIFLRVQEFCLAVGLMLNNAK